jgi:hypothetical protein
LSSQDEVLEWLRNRRASGDDSFFSSTDIQNSIGLQRRTYEKLMILHDFGYLEMTQEGYNHKSRKYRAKVKA